MTQKFSELDAPKLLEAVASRVPAEIRNNIVVIGSIAAAWAFRDISGRATVATKDIDLLLRPGVDAVATAQLLGQRLLSEGWVPQFNEGRVPGHAATADAELPALRLTPPGSDEGWFVELLSEPSGEQAERRHWRRFDTPQGVFGLPSFRYMAIAVHDAEESAFGLRVARPACMALAHLLEHAQPDRNPISTQSGFLRFQKDVAEQFRYGGWQASKQ